MNQLHYTITLISIVHLGTILTDWVPYKGMWYYISESETLDFTDATDYCASLSGRLVVFTDNHMIDFLKQQTGNERRWIGLQTITLTDRDFCFAYTLINKSQPIEAVDCSTALGMICQWQCGVLQIKTQNGINDVFQQYHSQYGRDYYRSIASYGNVLRYLTCTNKPTRCYRKWYSFSDTSIQLINEFDDFTPYNHSYWLKGNSNEVIHVSFVCHDCWEYDISFRKGILNHTARLQKYQRYKYNYTNINDNDSPSFGYNASSSLWCYSQKYSINVCFNFTIYPIGYLFITTIDSIELNISCRSMDHKDDTDGDGLPTLPHMTRSSTTPVDVLTTQPIETTTQEILVLHSLGYQKPGSAATIDPTSDPYGDSKQQQQTKINDTHISIGIAIGVVLLLVITITTGVVVFKRRRESKKNSKTSTQNLDNVHVITDTNIYSEQPSVRESPTSRIPDIPARNGLSNPTNIAGTAPNIQHRNQIESRRRAVPVPDSSVDQSFISHNQVSADDRACYHGSSTNAHGSSNRPIYSEVNKQKKPVPPLPTEPVYSQISKRAKTVNGEHKHDNIKSDWANGSHTNTGNNSDEEFSDNELYERGTPVLAQRQTNVSTNVVDNKAFDNASEDDNIEMVYNDVYGQK